MFEPKAERRLPQSCRKVIPKGGPAPPGANRGEGGEKFKPQQPGEDTRALWEHFLECTRSRNPETLCPADLGYAAITTVNLGVQSYREGKAYYFDKETGESSHADRAWSARWEETKQASRQAEPGHRLEGRRRQGLCSSRRTTRSSRATGSTARIRLRRLECNAVPSKYREASSRGRVVARAALPLRFSLLQPTVAANRSASAEFPVAVRRRRAGEQNAAARGRRKMTRSAGSPAARRGIGRPSRRAGLVVTVGDRLLERPARRGTSRFRRPTSSPWFEPAR